MLCVTKIISFQSKIYFCHSTLHVINQLSTITGRQATPTHFKICLPSTLISFLIRIKLYIDNDFPLFYTVPFWECWPLSSASRTCTHPLGHNWNTTSSIKSSSNHSPKQNRLYSQHTRYINYTLITPGTRFSTLLCIPSGESPGQWLSYTVYTTRSK